jgi:lauroyl/myristoyl acyltransferase
VGGVSFDAWLDGIEQPAYQGIRAAELPLRDRLSASPALRSAVPLRVAVAAALVRGRRRFDADPEARAAALEWAAGHIVSEPTPEAVEALARAALGDEAVQDALRRRRRLPRRTRIVGLDELHRARDGGRGAVIAGLRLGPSYALPALLARRLGRVYLVASRDPREHRPVRNRKTQHKAVWRARAEAAGVRFVGPSAPGELAELLRRGMVVFRFMDTGRMHRVELLGRRFDLAVEPSELAFAADVPVFPALIVRRSGRLHAELLPRLEPRPDSAPEELHDRIAAALDPALRAHLPQLYPNGLPTAERAAREAAKEERRRARRARAQRATLPSE